MRIPCPILRCCSLWQASKLVSTRFTRARLIHTKSAYKLAVRAGEFRVFRLLATFNTKQTQCFGRLRSADLFRVPKAASYGKLSTKNFDLANQFSFAPCP